MRLGGRSDSDFDDFALAAWPRLRWSAYLLCGDHQLAEDLAQTALVRTYGRWGTIRRSDAMAYTRKVLVNLNIDRVRRKRPVELGDLAADAMTAPDRTTGSDDRDEVVRLLSALTEKDMPGADCYPALVSTVGGSSYLQWSMGSDDFLEPGKEMELFTSEDYSSGSPSTVWIGGLDGTDVTRVAFDLADGSTTEAEVMAGTFVPGDTMFWANVPGELTHVTAYDANGDVVDDHAVTPCSGGVDCEVR